MILFAEVPALAELSWLYLPTALLLGALHGLEPGHSKTLMASFIIAIRGTAKQAALLGLCVALSHTAVIWALVAGAYALGKAVKIEEIEPVLRLVSGLIILAVAGWMFYRLRRSHRHHHHHHEHAHACCGGHDHDHDDDDHEEDDEHMREHAAEIERQFGDRSATTGQIVLFGLTGGLMPCPSALAVLLLCLQSGKAVLGFWVVLGFSVGLAATLVAVGVAAAWGAGKVMEGKRLQSFAAKMPYVSMGLLAALGLFLTVRGAMTVF